MNSRAEALRAVAYGNSYPASPERGAYLQRLARRYGWSLNNRAVGGERSTDTAARITAGAPAGRYVHGEADLVLVDSATNDYMGAGMAALSGYRHAMQASLAWLSLEGPVEDSRTDLISYTGGWAVSTGPEWSGGTQRAMSAPAAAATMPAFGRAGRWAFGYYGLAVGGGNGGPFQVTADDQVVADLNTHAQCVPSLSPAVGGGPRNWTPAAAVVNLPSPADRFGLRRTPDLPVGGGPFFSWYGKINEVNPPLIVCPSPVRLSSAGYALNGSPGLVTDDVVAAYGCALREAAAAVGPHVLVVDVDAGWEPATMLAPDRMHPNLRGSAHIADRITDALEALTW